MAAIIRSAAGPRVTARDDAGCGHAAVDAAAVFRSALQVLASSGDELFHVTISDNIATRLPSLS